MLSYLNIYNNFNFLEFLYFLNSLHLEFTLNYITYFSFIPLLYLNIYFFFKNLILLISFKLNVTTSILFTFKFLILIALLVFIRGGIPRYRYDFLTKIG